MKQIRTMTKTRTVLVQEKIIIRDEIEHPPSTPHSRRYNNARFFFDHNNIEEVKVVNKQNNNCIIA